MAQKLVKKHGFAKKSGVQGYLYQFHIIVITNLPFFPLSRYSKFLNQSIHHSMIIDLVIIRKEFFHSHLVLALECLKVFNISLKIVKIRSSNSSRTYLQVKKLMFIWLRLIFGNYVEAKNKK